MDADMEERRRADHEWRQHAQSHMDHLSEEQRMIRSLLDAVVRRLSSLEDDDRQRTMRLSKIEAALFDRNGNSKLDDVLDLLRASKAGVRILAWLVSLGSSVIALLAWFKLGGKP